MIISSVKERLKSTFDISRAEVFISPRPPVPASPTTIAPLFAVTLKRFPPIYSRPELFATEAIAIFATAKVLPLVNSPKILPLSSTRIASGFKLPEV